MKNTNSGEKYLYYYFMILKIFSIFFLLIFLNKNCYCQKIANWSGSSRPLKFYCGKAFRIGGRTVDVYYYVGLSKKQVLIGNHYYRKLIFGGDSSYVVGHIRVYKDTIFLCNGSSKKEMPFLSLSKNLKEFRTWIPSRLDGIFCCSSSIERDTLQLMSDTLNAVRFNINPSSVAADQSYESSILINNIGIISFDVKTGFGGTLHCKCQNP